MRKKFSFYIMALCFFTLATSPCAFSSPVSRFDFPDRYCRVTEKYEGTTENEAVIFIQDIHSSYAAQRNLIKILTFLSERHHINLIGVEGASGKISAPEITNFPDSAVKQNVLEYFLRNGEIHGSEYYSLLRSDEQGDAVELFGIEDKALYKRNYNSYMCSVDARGQLIHCLSMLSEALETIRAKVYSAELYDFDQAVRSFSGDEQNLVSYIKKLAVQAEARSVDYSGQKNIAGLLNLIQQESEIDFHQVEKEKNVLINQLKKALTDDDAQQLSKNEMLYKLNRISTAEYFAGLDRLLKDHAVSRDVCTEFSRYLSYLAAFSSLNCDRLAEEAKILEKAIYASMLKTPDEKRVYVISQYIGYLSLFANLKMTRSVFADYASCDISLHDAFSFIEHNVPEYYTQNLASVDCSSIEMSVAHASEFYQLVLERDRHMVDNLLAKMKEDSVSSSVLIAGGFHDEGIREQLRQRGISFITVVPSDEPDSERLPYMSLLKNLKSPLDTFFLADTNTLKVASWLAQEPLAFKERKPLLLAKIKTLLVTTKLFELYQARLEQHPLRPEGYAVPSDIGNQLQEMINDLIVKAGYSDLLEVTEVRPLAGNLYTEIAFKDDDGEKNKRVVVRLTDNKPLQHLGVEAARSIIETVRLSTGLTEEFLDYNAYNRIQLYENRIQSGILKFLSEQSGTVSDIETYARDSIGMDILHGETENYLDLFTGMGLVQKTVSAESTDDEFYSLSDSVSGGLFMRILYQLEKAYAQNGAFPSMISLDINDLQDVVHQQYPFVSERVSAVLIDINVPLHTLIPALSSLFENMVKIEQGNVSLTGLDVRFIGLPEEDKQLVHVSLRSGDVQAPGKLNGRYTAPEFNFESLKNVRAASVQQHDLKPNQMELIELAQSGDKQAEEILMQKNEGLALSVAQRMFGRLNFARGTVLRLDDLTASAKEGLWQAIQFYNPEKGAKFSTFAVACMQNAIRSNLAATNWMKQAAAKRVQEYKEAVRVLYERLERSPQDEEIADYMGISMTALAKAKELSTRALVSLDAPLKPDDSKSSLLLDFIKSDEEDDSPEAITIARQRREMLQQALTFLDFRTQEMMRMYMEGMTQAEIADVYGLSRQRMNQIIEGETIEKLRNIIQFRGVVGGENLAKIKAVVAESFGKLSLRDTEVLTLAYTTNLSPEQIAARLNFESVDALNQYRGEVDAKFESMLMERPEYANNKRVMKRNSLDWSMFLRHLMPNREGYVLESIKDLYNRIAVVPVPNYKLDEILADYEKLFTPVEQYLMLLTQYEGLRLTEAAEVLGVNIVKATWMSRRLRNKLLAIVDVRTTFTARQREELAEDFLYAFNTLPVRSRTVLVDLYYENISMRDIGERISMNDTSIHNIRTAILDHIKRYMRFQIGSAELAALLWRNVNLNSDAQVEQFLYGFISDIPRDKILLERKRPDDLTEVFEGVLHKQGNVIVTPELKELLKIYARFIHPSNAKFLTEYYVCDYASRQAAENLGMNRSTYQPRLYMEVIPALNEFVEYYMSFSPDEMTMLRKLAAKFINELPQRQKEFVINFAYDEMSYDEIGARYELNTKNDAHHQRVYNACRLAWQKLLENIDSEDLRNRLTPNKRLNAKFMNYFFCGLKYEIPRTAFNVPDPAWDAKSITYDSEGVLQDFYDDAFLREVYEWLGVKGDPDQKSLRELSMILDTLFEQQINILYYRFAKHYTVEQAAVDLNIGVGGLYSAQKGAKPRINKFLSFLKRFSREDLEYLHEMMAQTLETLELSPEYKAVLIYYGYDNITAKEAIQAVGITSKSNASNPFQKANSMKQLRAKLLEKLDPERFQAVFECSTLEFDNLFLSMKTTIPRERFRVQESPAGRKNAAMKFPELNAAPEEKTARTGVNRREAPKAVFSKPEVNNLFQAVNANSIEDLKKYIGLFNEDGFQLPNPLVVNRNPAFAPLRATAANAQQARKHLMDTFLPMGLSYSEVLKLQMILEMSGYLAFTLPKQDVVVLDLDSLPFYEEMPYENMKERRKLSHYLALIGESYNGTKRTANFVVFSRKYNMAQLESLLGAELLAFFRAEGNQLLSSEFFPYYSGETDSARLARFMASVMESGGHHPLNIKFFSNNPDAMNAAKEFGFILADRDSDVYQALGLFSAVQPSNLKNLAVGNKAGRIKNLQMFRTAGYLALAGMELSNPSPAEKPKETNYYRFLDTSL
ncbi:MAG: sigma-70 family RNA polymerase sigma factor [Candidatus Auribacter fodinae]|uniref:Sigma-70 family RNA polymerase sigma factor n=1 Tax=Candidatus Auribacter fodinae TaxID=2093366 RepID=A0A3A4R4R8_9BACT|nr:MAG: sigma-70 family RNA polymerase sigma factor [Candidatus Auribacter fodinae]